MQGYLITFFTQQDRLHGKVPLADWLLEQAASLGLMGATINASIAGLGHDGQRHTINMFDFSDQPVQVTLVLKESDLNRLLAHLQAEQLDIFYMKTAVEFGRLGNPKP